MSAAKTAIRTSRAPQPVGSYSQGIRIGPFIFVSGQGPIDPATQQVAGQTIEQQTNQVLDNVAAILAESGAGLDDVIKATVHLADLDLFPGYDRAYSGRFSPPRPARTTVASGLMGILVEIDVIAYVET
jgi:2-iminobutanoate/2-iminopropanoate deaminase